MVWRMPGCRWHRSCPMLLLATLTLPSFSVTWNVINWWVCLVLAAHQLVPLCCIDIKCIIWWLKQVSIVSHSHPWYNSLDTELHEVGGSLNPIWQLGEAAELELSCEVIKSYLHALSTKLPTPSLHLLWLACTSVFWCLKKKWHL